MKGKFKLTSEDISLAIDEPLRYFLLNKRDSIVLFCKLKHWELFREICGNINLIFNPKQKIYIWYWDDVLFITRNKEIRKRFFKNYRKYQKNYKSFSKEQKISEPTGITGEFLSYPKCCIEAYMEDLKKNNESLEGLKSARRYLKQLKKLKIKKDIFEVKIRKDELNYKLLIPCNPKCPKALKRIKMLN